MQNTKIPEITVQQLSEKLKLTPESVILIDVRKSSEKAIADIGGSLIPIDEIQDRFSEIPKDGEVVIYCRSGARSGQVTQYLIENQGYENVANLRGGILAWADNIDSTITKY